MHIVNLEVGKYYTDEFGKVVWILQVVPAGNEHGDVYLGSDGEAYSKDGFVTRGHHRRQAIRGQLGQVPLVRPLGADGPHARDFFVRAI